jgi:hypothetical protein
MSSRWVKSEGDLTEVKMMKSPVKDSMNEQDSLLGPITVPIVAAQFHYAVIVSEFNSLVTDQLLRGALRTLESHQVSISNIAVVHVPGAYEIPFAANVLAPV